MQLQSLPRSHPQRGVTHFIAKLKFGQQLRATEFASRDFCPDHHRVGLAPAFLAGRLPLGAIVLLVAAMMFDELDTAFAEKGVLIDGGYGKLKGKAFRLSNMGDETAETMTDLFTKLDASMEELS